MIIAYPYLAELEEDGRFFVHFLDIEEAITQADTLEEAAFNATEVLSGILACRLEDNEEIPEPSVCPKNGYLAFPSSKVQAALLLRIARGNKYLVFTHYNSKSNTRDGFDCWIATFANTAHIGNKKPLTLQTVSLSFNLERDFELIKNYVNN